MKVEETIQEVFKYFGEQEGVKLLGIERDKDQNRYNLILVSRDNLTLVSQDGSGYNYSHHFLDAYLLNKAYPSGKHMADVLDHFLMDAVKEHLSLFKNKPVKEVPLFSEAVVGYRRWKLDDWVLSPTNYGSPWRPGVNTAKCQPHTNSNPFWSTGESAHHENPPEKDCHCGLNAFFDYQGEGWMQHAHKGSVIGAIVGWGKMHVHPDGFRAQYAQIVCLMGDGEHYLNDIAAMYQVPLVDSFEELQVEASKHGSPLPENLRPEEQVDQTVGQSMGQLYRQYSGTQVHNNQFWTTTGGTLSPPQQNPFSTAPMPSHIERQKEMLEAAKKARGKYKARPVKNPKKRSWKVKW